MSVPDPEQTSHRRVPGLASPAGQDAAVGAAV